MSSVDDITKMEVHATRLSPGAATAIWPGSRAESHRSRRGQRSGRISDQTTQLAGCDGIVESTVGIVSEFPSRGPILQKSRWAQRWILPAATFIVLLTGTLNVLLFQAQNRQHVERCADAENPGCSADNFKAPFFQEMLNCFAQAICYPLYYVDLWIQGWIGRDQAYFDYDKDDEAEQELNEWTPYAWIVPGICDFSNSVLLLVALARAPGSTVQVLRNFTVVVCAFLSACYLRRGIRVYQWIAVGVLSAGLIFTSIDTVSIQSAAEHYNTADTFVGILLTLSATVIAGFELVFEERLLTHYRVPPFLAVGWAGLWQIGLVAVTLVIAHFVGYEKLDIVWYQLTNDKTLIITSVGVWLSISVFTVSALVVTKLGNAVLTSIAFSARQIFLWTAELSLGWLSFHALGFVGILVSSLSFVFYHDLLPRRRGLTWYHRIGDKVVRTECQCADADAELADESEIDMYAEDLEESGADDTSTSAISSGMSRRHRSGISACSPRSAKDVPPSKGIAKRSSFRTGSGVSTVHGRRSGKTRATVVRSEQASEDIVVDITALHAQQGSNDCLTPAAGRYTVRRARLEHEAVVSRSPPPKLDGRQGGSRNAQNRPLWIQVTESTRVPAPSKSPALQALMSPDIVELA